MPFTLRYAFTLLGLGKRNKLNHVSGPCLRPRPRPRARPGPGPVTSRDGGRGRVSELPSGVRGPPPGLPRRLAASRPDAAAEGRGRKSSPRSVLSDEFMSPTQCRATLADELQLGQCELIGWTCEMFDTFPQLVPGCLGAIRAVLSPARHGKRGITVGSLQ